MTVLALSENPTSGAIMNVDTIKNILMVGCIINCINGRPPGVLLYSKKLKLTWSAVEFK